MKHLKTYEGVWAKNIKVGDFYKITDFLVAEKGYLSNIPVGKVIKIDEYSGFFVDVKTFIKKTGEEHIMYNLNKKHLLKKATPEEIDEFEAIEKSNQYNL